MDTLDDVLNNWDKDSVINGMDLNTEAVKIGKVMAKYLRALSKHNLRAKKLQQDHVRLRALKYQYFDGKLNGTDTLKDLGWPPFELKIPKVVIEETYLPSDKDLSDLLMKKEVSLEIVEACKYIIRELQNRTWQIKAAIDYEKYRSGI